MRCQLVHAVPGRARFRIDEPEVFLYGPTALESWLRGQAGVREVRVNPACRSLVVVHDARTVRAEDLRDRLAGFERVRVRDIPNAAPRPSPAGREDGTMGLPLALSTAAAWMAESQSALAPWLLVGAAIPVFRRAFDVLFRQSRLNVDVLDASATTVLLSQGSFGTAAIMVWLISLGDLLRNFTMQRSLRTIEGLYEGKDISTWIVRDGQAVRVKVEEVRPGDEVIVYPGPICGSPALLMTKPPS